MKEDATYLLPGRVVAKVAAVFAVLHRLEHDRWRAWLWLALLTVFVVMSRGHTSSIGAFLGAAAMTAFIFDTWWVHRQLRRARSDFGSLMGELAKYEVL